VLSCLARNGRIRGPRALARGVESPGEESAEPQLRPVRRGEAAIRPYRHQRGLRGGPDEEDNHRYSCAQACRQAQEPLVILPPAPRVGPSRTATRRSRPTLVDSHGRAQIGAWAYPRRRCDFVVSRPGKPCHPRPDGGVACNSGPWPHASASARSRHHSPPQETACRRERARRSAKWNPFAARRLWPRPSRRPPPATRQAG
jgi:hypothetical protein